MRYLAVIPARGGSKGIPGKNIKPLAGKPLIYYTLEVAKEVFPIEDICVSTDDDQIRKVVEDFGIAVSFMRPPELATDEAGMHEVLLHALDFYKAKGKEYDAVVLLQPTSPLRRAEHVREAMQLFSTDLDMVVSVKETNSNPYYVLFEENVQGYLEPSKKGNFVRRQDCPRVYEYNGAIYLINVSTLRNTQALRELKGIKKYQMDEYSSMDIDTDLDWKLAHLILTR